MKKTLLVLAGLIAAMPAMAQNYDEFNQLGSWAGLFMAYGVFVFIAAIAYYIVAAIGIMKLAKKFNIPNPWMAWIPILNIWLLLQIAGLQWWWLLIILFGGLVPVVGTIISLLTSVYIWMLIAKKAGKDQWFALLMLIPIVNLWAIFELAK
ncbi:MAG: DUF5684 domain-containing protein [Candidatus Paceibacterota bacterium]